MRQSTQSRTTKETDITLSLTIDGTGNISINTPIPFLNHMLTSLAFYAGWDLTIEAKGDTEIDDHHTVEDIGIVLGRAFFEALGDKRGLTRFASCKTPMDEALSDVTLDISNRPYLVYDVFFTRESIGGLSLENIKEFFYAFMIEARITLHISALYGDNNHHIAESIFKGVGRALNNATQINGQRITSTKGVL